MVALISIFATNIIKLIDVWYVDIILFLSVFWCSVPNSFTCWKCIDIGDRLLAEGHLHQSATFCYVHTFCECIFWPCLDSIDPHSMPLFFTNTYHIPIQINTYIYIYINMPTDIRLWICGHLDEQSYRTSLTRSSRKSNSILMHLLTALFILFCFCMHECSWPYCCWMIYFCRFIVFQDGWSITSDVFIHPFPPIKLKVGPNWLFCAFRYIFEPKMGRTDCRSSWWWAKLSVWCDSIWPVVSSALWRVIWRIPLMSKLWTPFWQLRQKIVRFFIFFLQNNRHVEM